MHHFDWLISKTKQGRLVLRWEISSKYQGCKLDWKVFLKSTEKDNRKPLADCWQENYMDMLMKPPGVVLSSKELYF